MSYLDDHRVRGVMVVPAAVQLISVLAAAESVTDTPSQIEDLAFLRPLNVSDEGARIVQLIHDGENGAVEIHSREEDGDEWMLHASGYLRAAGGEAPSIEPREIQARCPEELDPESFCAETGEGALHLGVSMQWLEQIWRRDGEALARLRSASSRSLAEVHPGLIDSVCRLLAATLSDQDRRDLYLPFRIARCRFHRLPGEGDLWCHAVLRSDPESDGEIGDIRLVDAAGETLFEVEGLEIRRADRKPVPEQRPESWLHQLEWHPEPRTEEATDSQGERWLIFADELGLGEALARELSRANHQIEMVHIGEQFEPSSSDRWRLNPERPEDFSRLFAELGGEPRLTRIVHLWSLRDENPRYPDLEPAQEQGLRSLLHLIQALAATDGDGSLWLVTRGALATGADDRNARVSQAPAWGLLGVASQELRNHTCAGVDLDPQPGGLEDEARNLAAELLASTGEDRIALRRDERRIARLVPNEGLATSSLDPRAEATYVVTGGLGSLGLYVADWLVRKGVRHLVLVGRRDPSDEAREAIRRLETSGARVETRSADVSISEDVSRLMADLQASMPAVRGIVHAAGLVDDGALTNQDWQRFRRVLAPKIEGSWNLHQATLGLDVDFFVLFSSTASLLCPPGQGSYAAGNAFLDALAHHRRSLGLPALSLNWGPWAEGGMAAELGDRVHRQWRESGIGMIEPSQGLELLEGLLGGDAAQVGVIPIDWPRYVANLEGAVPSMLQELGKEEAAIEPPEPADESPVEDAGPAFPESAEDLRNRLDQSSGQARRDLLAEHVRVEARRILRLGPEQPIAEDRNLLTLGLDSLMALELRNALQSSVDQPLPGTLVVDQPTVAELAAFLEDELFG